jgi:hypothetical protein
MPKFASQKRFTSASVPASWLKSWEGMPTTTSPAFARSVCSFCRASYWRV